MCAACDGEGWIVPGALAGYLEDLVAVVEDKSGADLDVMAVLIHKIAGVSNPADLQELVRQHLAAKGIKARPTLPDHPEPPSTAAETPDPVEPAAEEPDLEPPALEALVAAVAAQPGVKLDEAAVTLAELAQITNPADHKELVRQFLAAKGIKARPTSLEPLNPPGVVAETPDPPETAQPAAEEPDLEPSALEALAAGVAAQPGAALDEAAVTVAEIAEIENPAEPEALVRQLLDAKGIKARPTLPKHPEPPEAPAETPDSPEPAGPAAKAAELPEPAEQAEDPPDLAEMQARVLAGRGIRASAGVTIAQRLPHEGGRKSRRTEDLEELIVADAARKERFGPDLYRRPGGSSGGPSADASGGAMKMMKAIALATVSTARIPRAGLVMTVRLRIAPPPVLHVPESPNCPCPRSPAGATCGT